MKAPNSQLEKNLSGRGKGKGNKQKKAGVYRGVLKQEKKPGRSRAGWLALEPNANPIGKTFQEGIFKQGIPATAFEVEDIEQEFQRLKALGVAFTQGPSRHGPVTIAVCADTCGNLIQLYQKTLAVDEVGARRDNDP